MLIIAISFGNNDFDGYSCAIKADDIDPDDPQRCLDFICKKQVLQPESIDQLLIVKSNWFNGDSEIIRHYTSIEGHFIAEEED